MKRYISVIITFTILAAWFVPGTAKVVKTEHVEAELISEVTSIQAGQPFWVGLRLKMAPHWHVYWRNPGDAGLPTSISWELPEGFSAGEIRWPHPERIPFGEFVNFGYEDEVLLPVEITPPDQLPPGDSLRIDARAEWLVCKDICVPESAELALILGSGADIAQANSETLAAFAEARARLPLKASDWQVQATTSDSTLKILATPPAWFSDEMSRITFFPYDDFVIHNSRSQTLQKMGRAYHLTVPLSPDRAEDPQEINGVLVTDTGWRGAGSEKALEISAEVRDRLDLPAEAGEKEVSTLWIALIFAFAGGIILNLMPCVLPVLSLKILGFVQQAGEDRRRTLKHGLLFTLGVLMSFWVLAGVLLLLQAGGEQLGWGFQLQSPTFLTILSIFLFLFGLSLFGVFEIGTSLTGLGQNAAAQTDNAGSFLSGVLATVVATPCTAPFMGSALGFALTQPAYGSMLIFSALGLGMATPYLILAATPALLRFVPKPGPWMESLKQFMGFLLMGTVVWLLWVLGIQTGSDGVISLLVALLFAGLGAWVLGRWGNLSRGKATRIVAYLFAGIAIAGGLAFSLSSIDTARAADRSQSLNSAGELPWRKFSPQLVEELRREGKPVFIDFTAAWCLSCQVNKKVAFGSEEVQAAFAEKGVVPVVADWTSRDETITRALAKFGRNSVPLYVLYRPGYQDTPIILPEVLTPGIVLEALAKID